MSGQAPESWARGSEFPDQEFPGSLGIVVDLDAKGVDADEVESILECEHRHPAPLLLGFEGSNPQDSCGPNSGVRVTEERLEDVYFGEPMAYEVSDESAPSFKTDSVEDFATPRRHSALAQAI